MLFKKIDPASENTVTSALNIFDTPPTSVAVSNAHYREYLTLNPISSRPFHFKIHPVTSFMDLSKVYLFTEMRIRKWDTTTSEYVDIADTDNVAPIQMIGSTFIKNVVVSVNQRETFNANQLYAYKAYLDTELSYPSHVKDTYLTGWGYARESIDQNDIKGAGFVKRKAMFLKSKSCQFMTKLDADLFNTELYLINNCEVDIEISPHTDDFVLMQKKETTATQTKFTLEIVSCKLYVKMVDLMDGLSLDIARRLDTQPARYGLRRSLLKSLFITEGRTEFTANLFTEQVPRRLIVGLLANSCYIGNKHQSPFNFGHHDVREIGIMANGRAYPQVNYQLDYANKNYIRAYHDMHENIGHANTSDSNAIDYAMFKSGWCIYVFLLTNSMEDEQAFELIKNGTTAIMIRFNEPVPAGGVTLIAYAETDALMMVDKNRGLSSDVTV